MQWTSRWRQDLSHTTAKGYLLPRTRLICWHRSYIGVLFKRRLTSFLFSGGRHDISSVEARICSSDGIVHFISPRERKDAHAILTSNTHTYTHSEEKTYKHTRTYTLFVSRSSCSVTFDEALINTNRMGKTNLTGRELVDHWFSLSLLLLLVTRRKHGQWTVIQNNGNHQVISRWRCSFECRFRHALSPLSFTLVVTSSVSVLPEVLFFLWASTDNAPSSFRIRVNIHT